MSGYVIESTPSQKCIICKTSKNENKIIIEIAKMKFEIKIYHLWMRLFSCFILYIFILKNRYKTQDNAVFWFRRCKIFTQKILLWPRILKPSGYCFNQRVVWTAVVNFPLKTLLTSFVLFSFKPPLRNSYIILRLK